MPPKRLLFFFFFFLSCYILPLGVHGLAFPDETRYAEIPREMISRGEWIVPHFNGLRYFEKPVLGYWAHALSLLWLGENNFAVRLPSALSVGLSALCVFLLALHALRRSREAVLSAGIFLSSLGIFGIGNTAVLDNLFSFFITAALLFFYFASESPSGSRKEKIRLCLSGLFCALAFLTKGFLAFLIPALVCIPWLLWERRFGDIVRMALPPLLVAVLAVLPWAVAIHMRDPDFWNFFFWHEHIRRLAAVNAQHSKPFWFFFLTAPLMAFPWAFVFPAAVPGIKDRLPQQNAEGSLTRFSLCWLLLPFLFFSIAKGKLITYILPCFPPFAVLTGLGLLGNSAGFLRRKTFDRGITAATAFGAAILAAFLYVQLRGYKGFRPYGHAGQAIMIVNSLVFMMLCLREAVKSADTGKKIMMTAAAPLFLFVSSHFLVPDLTEETKMPGFFLEARRENVAQDSIVIVDEELVGPVCWFLKRDDLYLLGKGGELSYGLERAEAQNRRLDIAQAAALMKSNPGKVVLITNAPNTEKWQSRLPEPLEEYRSGFSRYLVWKKY